VGRPRSASACVPGQEAFVAPHLGETTRYAYLKNYIVTFY
jgi:hypothetical protein